MTEQLKSMPFAPSAQMNAVPVDLSDDDMGESDSDLEVRISRKCFLRINTSCCLIYASQNGRETYLSLATATHCQIQKRTSHLCSSGGHLRPCSPSLHMRTRVLDGGLVVQGQTTGSSNSKCSSRSPCRCSCKRKLKVMQAME